MLHKRLITLLFLLLAISGLQAQKTFVPDEYGYVNDPEFYELIKSRGYQLVGSFEKVGKNRREQYARIKSKYDDGYGFINLKGEEVIKPRFLNIDYFKEGLARVTIEGSRSMPYTGGGCMVSYGVEMFAFINLQDSIVTKTYSSATPFYKGKSIVSLGSGYRDQPYGIGVIDLKGNEITPLVYDEVRLSDDHIFAKKEKLWALLSDDGRELSDFLYDYIQSYNGFLLAEKDNLFVVLNPKTGLPFEGAVFDYINLHDYNQFYSNIYNTDMSHLVMKRGKDYFLINRKGQKISTNFTFIKRVSNKLFSTTTNTTYGVLNNKGKLITETDNKFYGPYEHGKIYVKYTDNKNTYYDKNFKKIPTAQYNWVGNYVNGFAPVGRNKKYGFINTKGKEILPLIYDSPGNGFQHKDGAIVQLNGKWGVINRKGKNVIPFKYDFIYFSNGLYHLTINQKNGLADTAGFIIIPPAYGSIHPTYDINNAENYFVWLNSKNGIIDKDRNIVVPIVYDFMNNFYYEGMLEVRKGELFGFVDRNGKEIIPCKYDYVQQFENGIALVQASSEEKCIDRYGNELLIGKDEYQGY
jgi:hypothetical protein